MYRPIYGITRLTGYFSSSLYTYFITLNPDLCSHFEQSLLSSKRQQTYACNWQCSCNTSVRFMAYDLFNNL